MLISKLGLSVNCRVNFKFKSSSTSVSTKVLDITWFIMLIAIIIYIIVMLIIRIKTIISSMKRQITEEVKSEISIKKSSKGIKKGVLLMNVLKKNTFEWFFIVFSFIVLIIIAILIICIIIHQLSDYNLMLSSGILILLFIGFLMFSIILVVTVPSHGTTMNSVLYANIIDFDTKQLEKDINKQSSLISNDTIKNKNITKNYNTTNDLLDNLILDLESKNDVIVNTPLIDQAYVEGELQLNLNNLNSIYLIKKVFYDQYNKNLLNLQTMCSTTEISKIMIAINKQYELFTSVFSSTPIIDIVFNNMLPVKIVAQDIYSSILSSPGNSINQDTSGYFDKNKVSFFPGYSITSGTNKILSVKYVDNSIIPKVDSSTIPKINGIKSSDSITNIFDQRLLDVLSAIQLNVINEQTLSMNKFNFTFKPNIANLLFPLLIDKYKFTSFDFNASFIPITINNQLHPYFTNFENIEEKIATIEGDYKITYSDRFSYVSPLIIKIYYKDQIQRTIYLSPSPLDRLCVMKKDNVISIFTPNQIVVQDGNVVTYTDISNKFIRGINYDFQDINCVTTYIDTDNFGGHWFPSMYLTLKSLSKDDSTFIELNSLARSIVIQINNKIFTFSLSVFDGDYSSKLTNFIYKAFTISDNGSIDELAPTGGRIPSKK